MLYIYFNGTKPQQQTYSYGVQKNNRANVIRFLIDHHQQEINLSSYSCQLKVRNIENDYLDLIDLSDEIVISGSYLEITWLLTSKSTQFKNLELQLQFISSDDDDNEILWQTEIFNLELSGNIDNVNETVSEQNATVIEQLLVKVNQYDNRIKALEQKPYNKYALIDANNHYSATQMFDGGVEISMPEGDASLEFVDDNNVNCYGNWTFFGNLNVETDDGVIFSFADNKLKCYRDIWLDDYNIVGVYAIEGSYELNLVNSADWETSLRITNDNIYFTTTDTGFSFRQIMTENTGVAYLNTAPTSIFDGNPNFDSMKIVVLNQEPATKYDGYIYIITEE